jgi:hypothetical protein
LALRLLKALHEAAQGNRHLNQAYSAFSQLERDLGKLIVAVLSRLSNTDDIEEFFPKRVLDHTRTANGVSYSLATYDDLIDIILENWEYFQIIFRGVGKGRLRNGSRA